MPSQLDDLIKSLQPLTGSPSTGGPVSNSTGTSKTSQLDELIQSLTPVGSPHVSTNPLTTPVAPTGVYNTSDFSKINVDQEVTNTTFRNMWNSFKRGIDEIQVSTAQGKFEYSPFGDSAGQIIDNYPDQKQDLDTQLQRGLIDEGEYTRQIQSLNTSYQNALSAKSDMDRTVAANEVEIQQEPVSKEYQYRNWLTQQSGSEAPTWDKLIYSMPQVLGSSASLLVPQLAATFGSNITKALLRSSISYVAGPEVGVPANAIATIGAIGISLAEIAWGRAQESYGEVGGTIIQNREMLMNQYAQENGIQVDQIPEEVQRQIRIQSRKGADTQFMENMALAASDAAQAILMPGSQLAGNIGEAFGSVGKLIKSAGDYSRLTRTLRTIGKAYYGALGEKFEEGYQQAAQYRATDEALGTNKYANKGLMANILTDSWDTAASLNYSLLPGLTLRGNGRYSQDKEFQFAEDSGGMLGLFMSAVPTAISVGKDFATYRTATKRLAKEGVINPDDKIFRLQNDILKQYFDKDQVPYLVEAMRSLRGKKGENGEEIMPQDAFVESTKNIKDAYRIYEGVAERVNQLKGDKWAFFNSKELSQARALIKEDLLHNALGTVKQRKTVANAQSTRDKAKLDDTNLSNDNPLLSNYKSLLNQLENAGNTKDLIDQYLNQDLDTIPNVGERSRAGIQARSNFLNNYITNLQQQIEQERSSLEASNIDYSNALEVGTDLNTANQNLIVAEMNLNEYTSKYNDLLKIKDYKQAKEYFRQQTATRGFAEGSPLNTDEGAEEAEPTNRTNSSTEPFGSTEDYEEEDPQEGSVENNSTDTELTAFTGMSTEAEPTGETHISDTVREAFQNALDDLEATYDDMEQPAKTAAERIALLEQGLANAGIDLSKLSFANLYKIFRDNFASTPDYVREKFESLRALSQLYKANTGASQQEIDEIRKIELEPDTLNLLGIAREYSTPPEQTVEAVSVANDNIIRSAKQEESELEQGTGLKIVSGLSLATANVISGRAATGEVGDFRENGQIQFSENTDQQLVNTNFVKVGDTVNIRINNLPEGFDISNTSDDNYDLVNIEVYKTVSNSTATGTVERELLLGSLHRLSKLPELLAESADKKAEIEKLRIQRQNIIQSASRSFTASVASKGFGFLNKNNRNLQTSIYNAFGDDGRVHISTVAASGQAIETRDGLVYKRGITPLIPGATILFIPNETNNGTVYLPIYLTKNQLKKNEDILNKTTASITEFLKTGSRKFMADAEQYTYITREPEEKLGLKGVFWGYTKEGNVPYVNINGTRYNMKNVNSLKSALGNIYFTPNRNALSKVQGYELEIVKSGLLTTNIQNNKVLSSRFKSGEYSFLKDYQANQYFSQHTIDLDQFVEQKAVTPESRQTESQSTDPKQQISNLRAERVQRAIDLGFAMEGASGSMQVIYNEVKSYLADPEVQGDIEQTDDILRAQDFVAMYDEYEAKINKIKADNNIVVGSVTTQGSSSDESRNRNPVPPKPAANQVEQSREPSDYEYKPSNIVGSFYSINDDVLTEVSPDSVKSEHIFGLERVSENEYKVSSFIQNGRELIQGSHLFIRPLFQEDNLITTWTKAYIREPAIVKREGNKFTLVKRGIVFYDTTPAKYMEQRPTIDQVIESESNMSPTREGFDTTQAGNSIEGQFTEEENQDVADQLTDLGIDLDFDDLIGFTPLEYSDQYKLNLRTNLGLKEGLGVRYSDQEVEYIREALNRFNKANNTSHQIYSSRIGGQNAVTVSLQKETTVDDIQEGAPSLESKLLVSKDISATLQNQMVDSIAYALLTNEKPDSTVSAEQQDISNKGRVKADFENKLAKFNKMLTQPNTAQVLDKIQTLAKNYQLIVTHYDGLYDKAIEVLNNLGFEATDENSDYFENLEEQFEDNNATQFNDDSNSTRNQKNFLPAEVKKLIYFIPNLQLRDLSDPKQVAEMEDPKNPYFQKNYKAKPNSLGLPSFNDFNDTWEKTLSIISQRTYSSDDSGFNQMLEVLQKEQNPIIVKELASRLQKANDQVKNAFFRRTYLQRQQNKTTIVNYKTNKSWKDQQEVWHQGTTTKTTQIINSDQRQGIRFIANQLEQEFRVQGLQTGILNTEIETSTGRAISKVNTVFGKDLLNQIEELIKDNGNYIIERAAVANVKAKYTNKFTDQAKMALWSIIKQTGMNLSYGALNDLLKYYKVANSQYVGDERAVAIEVFQNTIFKRLAGQTTSPNIANKVESEEITQESDYETNNPFRKDPSTIQSLARYEFAYRVQTQSGSYRSNGKSYYPFTRHSYLSEMITDMTAWLRDRTPGQSAQKNVFAKLEFDRFAQSSIYLKAIANPVANPEFAKIFKLRYELGTRNRASLDGTDKLLQEMVEREHQILKITDFQNSGNRAAAFHYDTLSDKITKPIIDAPKRDVMYATASQSVDAGNITLAGQTMDDLYTYFEAEYNRINDVREQNGTLQNHEKIKAYHDIGKKEGMGKFFNIYYFLNKDVLAVDNSTLASELYNVDGSLKPLTPELEVQVKDEINKHFNKLFAKTKEDFRNLGLFDLENRNTRKEFDPLIQDMVDANYLKKNAVKLGLENFKGLNKGNYYNLSQEQLNRIIDFAIVDYVVNYSIFSNEMLIFTGDPAQAGKLASGDTLQVIRERFPDDELQQKKFNSIAHVESTFVNVGKRNAAFLGSGEKGKFQNSSYSVAIANDINIGSPQFEQYKSLFKGNEGAVKKAYNDGDLTDAQEVTTVEEHLHTMMAFGQITKDQYKKFLYIYDRGHYNQLFPNQSENVSAKDRFEAFGIVMQPMKPVQRTYNIDAALHMSKQYYIKTSSYPLVPDMIEGTPLQGLLDDMKKNKVQRVAFVSATKQGVAGSKDLFNKDGLYNEEFLTNNQNILERDGFRIQLEVPYKDSKDAIREGTQLAKLLFVDIPEDLSVSFQGRQAKISELKDKYNDYHRKIIDYKTQELYTELGAEVDTETGLPIIKDIKKLAKIIQEEGIGRGYSLNALLGLDLNAKGEFKVPLTFLPNTGQIQPVLTAIVSNRIARLKMPGKSYVQGSEFVLNRGKVQSDLDQVDKRNIVWTKPEYSGTSKLKYLREEGGKVKPAQIIMPFYFIDQESGKRVDLRKYTTKDAEGRTLLDASKIDPELLEMNGFRIPFQGHNSGMWFEIIGFLPYEMGDLIIVPGEIAAQMGSDYDVDKLYAYMFNYTLGDSGKLDKVKSENPDSVEGYQNALIDIHKSIFTSKDLFQPILDPLSFADVEEAIAELGSEESKEFLGAFDPTYQRDVYFSNRGGQLGVGITANANTSHAMGQTVRLFVKGQGVVFLDEEGQPYTDNPTDGDTNGVRPITDQNKNTVYAYAEQGEEINQNDGTQKSAWRLDKIYTFTKNPKTGQPYKISNLISQLLGVSVDNAKEQKLGAYGLNKHNFNVAISIVRAGFDLITTKAFINQPILKEYYDAIGGTEDMFTIDFTPNKREQVVKDIFKKYGERFNVDHNSIFERDFIEGFSLNDMKASLAKGIVNESNAKEQLEVLKAFLHYKTLSDGLQALTSALNIDTKGLPKNVSETINKASDIQDNVTSNVMFGNTQAFYTRTIPGLFSNLPTIFESLFSNPDAPLFAYKSAAYVAAQNKIESLTGRPIVGQEKLDRFHNSIKQFIYTSPNITKFENLDNYRRLLLFDQEGNSSLQTNYLTLLAKYPTNDLLKAINPIISEYANAPKRLEIASSTEDDYVERIRQYWEFMLNNSDDSDLQEFANNLVDYTLLLSSQEFGTSNLIKYVPFSALEERGFGDELNRVNNAVFQDEDFLNSFVNQFIQHESDYVLAAKEKNFKKGSVVYKTMTTIDGDKSVVNNTNIINSFSLDKYDPNNLSSNPAASLLREDADGNWDYPEVLTVFIDSQIGKLLYQKNQNSDGTVTYYRIDTLGGNNISEYDFSSPLGFKKSLFEENQSDAIVPTTQSSNKIFQTKVKQNISEDLSLPQIYFPTPDTSVGELLGTIRGRLGTINIGLNDDTSNMFLALADAIDAYNLVTPIEVNGNHNTPGSTGVTDDGEVTRIVFNPSRVFGNTSRTGLPVELEGVRTILHEMVHALTLSQLQVPAYRESPQFRQLNSVWEEYKSVIRSQSKAKERGVNVNVYDAEMFKILLDRYKQFRGSNTRQSDLYTADLVTTINNLQKPENQSEVVDLLVGLGKNLQSLSDQGLVEKANYNLTANTERFEKFRDRLFNTFKNQMADNINKYYSYYSIEEFVTEALTNPRTQEELKKIPSLWDRLRNALTSLIARILGLDKNSRTLLDDAIDATIDLVELKNKINISEQKQENLAVAGKDTYQYYGAKYTILVDGTGKGIDVEGYKGADRTKKVLLDAYNNNPDVDPQNGKFFRTPTKSQPSTQFHMSREYRLPSGKIIRFNDQQYSGLQSIDGWLKDPRKEFFTLAGYAGTGKTTIVKAILDTYKGRVAVSAPTHKAKNVISKTTGKSAVTIQKLLGLRPNVDLENFDPNKPVFDPLATPLIGSYNWLIVDEASMLNKALFNLLIKKAKESGTKILFMGDPAQIPPVGEVISDVFDSTQIDTRHELDKVERQAGSNPLMSIYDKIRSNISSAIDLFDHKTKINAQGEGIEFTANSAKFESEVIKTFLSNEYESDRNFAKVIAYRNKVVGNWNTVIRKALFGDNAAQYEKGDTIMAYTSITTPLLTIENSSDYVVENVVSLRNNGAFGFDGYRLTIRDIEANIKKEVFIVKNDEANKAKYLDTYNTLLAQAKATKKWTAYYAFRNNNLLGADITIGDKVLVSKDFDYGYAITAHKSQGSTFTHAFVIEGDIDSNSDATERNKLKYVAFSRPTTKVMSLTSKAEQEGTNFYIEQDEMLLSLPRDVNEVSDKELEELLNFCK